MLFALRWDRWRACSEARRLDLGLCYQISGQKGIGVIPLPAGQAQRLAHMIGGLRVAARIDLDIAQQEAGARLDTQLRRLALAQRRDDLRREIPPGSQIPTRPVRRHAGFLPGRCTGIDLDADGPAQPVIQGGILDTANRRQRLRGGCGGGQACQQAGKDKEVQTFQRDMAFNEPMAQLEGRIRRRMRRNHDQDSIYRGAVR